MKKIILRCLSATFFLLAQNNLLAQNDSIQDNSYYFDDGGVAGSRNLLKINLLAVVHGDLAFNYERILSKRFSLEVGAGILLPYHIPDAAELILEEFPIQDPKNGYSLWIHPRYYVLDNAAERFYLGIQLRRRNYNLDNAGNQTIIYSDITYNCGFQWIIGKRYVFDLNYGLGFRSITKKGPGPDCENGTLTIPFGIKLGIIL